MRRRSRSRSGLTGSLVLLAAGIIVIAVAFSVPEATNPISFLLGGMVIVGGVIGLFKECRDVLGM